MPLDLKKGYSRRMLFNADARVDAAEIVLQICPTWIAHPVDAHLAEVLRQTPFPRFVHARRFFELVTILGRDEENAVPIQPEEGLRDFVMGTFFVGGPVDEFTLFEFLEGFLHRTIVTFR